jgi:hypothetical protein
LEVSDTWVMHVGEDHDRIRNAKLVVRLLEGYVTRTA